MKKRLNLTTILVMAALAIMMTFTPLACTSDTKNETEIKKETESAQQDQTNVKQEAEAAQQDQAVEKRKALFKEATAAINETKNALKALDEKKLEEALAALERASGKLTIILGREPELALAPSDVNVITYDILADIDAVKKLRKEIEDALDEGRVQQARRLIKNLASETVISVTNIPLATYPEAIKKAAKLIDEEKIDEAQKTLQVALNTLIVTDTIIPLPVTTAEEYLKEAETLAEKVDRSEEENKRLADLLIDARNELKFAQILGYGSKKDFKNLYEQLDQIEKKTEGGKSGTGFFDNIKGYLKDAVTSSQAESESGKEE